MIIRFSKLDCTQIACIVAQANRCCFAMLSEALEELPLSKEGAWKIGKSKYHVLKWYFVQAPHVAFEDFENSKSSSSLGQQLASWQFCSCSLPAVSLKENSGSLPHQNSVIPCPLSNVSLTDHVFRVTTKHRFIQLEKVTVSPFKEDIGH